MTTVLYRGPQLPLEWMAAHGLPLAPLLLHPGGGATGHAGMCPHAEALLREAGAFDGALVVLAGACDQIRRAAANVAAGSSRDTLFLFHVPATRGPAATRFYRDECLRLSRFLVRWGGTVPALDTVPAPLTDTRTPRHGPGVPIAVVGGPLLAGHEELYAAIERFGGAVAADGIEGGERTRPRFSTDAPFRDLLDAVIAARFDAIPDVFHRPNDALCDWLSECVTERGIRGLLCVSYTWCDLWRVEQRHLAAAVELPAFFLELDGETCLSVRTLTRIEAFLESIS